MNVTARYRTETGFIAAVLPTSSRIQRRRPTYLKYIHPLRRAMTTTHSSHLTPKLQFLRSYSACDISDALLKLQKASPPSIARAGHLADIVPYAPTSPFSGSCENSPKVVGVASTLKLIGKHDSPPKLVTEEHAVPKGQHWVDLTEQGTIVVIEQPPEQCCAAVGGIMALRMAERGVLGCVVGGRVRDLAELKESGLPIFAVGRSTVGTGAESMVLARQCPVNVRGVDINPGDVVFCDPLEGVVVIPVGVLDEVLELMPKLVAADDKVKEDVLKGGSVQEAFHKHRGKVG